MTAAPAWMLTDEAMPDLRVEALAPLWRLGHDHAWSWFETNRQAVPVELRPWVAIEAWLGGNPFTVRRPRTATVARELCAVWREVGFSPPAPMPERVPIYHGAPAHVTAGEIRCSLSWTLSPAVAGEFAHRYGRPGSVWASVVDADAVLCAHDVRGELEVIVDPQGLDRLRRVNRPATT